MTRNYLAEGERWYKGEPVSEGMVRRVMAVARKAKRERRDLDPREVMGAVFFSDAPLTPEQIAVGLEVAERHGLVERGEG